MINVAILASHNGSIFDALYDTSLNTINEQSKKIPFNIALIISNNSSALVLEKAKNHQIPNFLVNQSLTDNVDLEISNLLQKYNCKFVLLAGYMKKISPLLTNNFFILNSHPALLPAFGGAGMYGRFVHQAVIASGDKISGVTIHKVDENYDEGEIILQKSIILDENETVESLENKIKELEKIAILEALEICLK